MEKVYGNKVYGIKEHSLETDDKVVSEKTGAIKSDGGSSTYYDIPIPTKLLAEIIERRNEDGLSYIKTEEIIHLGLGNDFDAGNIFKCLVRMESLKQGKGKAGNSLEYDANKVLYSAKKIAGRAAGK